VTTTVSPRFTSDDEQLAALRVTFPINEIRSRDQGGSTLYYLEAYAIQQRLLDVLGAGLTIRTGQVITTENIVNTEIILDIDWVSGRKSSISGWGSADVLVSQKTGKTVNDPYKAAATDGIKVAASKLGVAGELYDSKYREGLKVRVETMEHEEAERAFLTCQECTGEIRGGTVSGKNGKLVTMTSKEVAVSTRKKWGRRLCIGCATSLREAGAEQASLQQD
jgi:hypothetical protein